MKKTVLTTVLFLGLATVVQAQWHITGYLFSEVMPTEIDSVYMEFGSNRTWFTTPGWTVEPGQTDSFAFPEFAGWPAIIKLRGQSGGIPIDDSLYRPAPDSWYPLTPPNDMVRVKFRGYVGIEEAPAKPSGKTLTTLLNIRHLTTLMQNPELEIVNYLGQPVSSHYLAPGVYFYRRSGSPVYHRLILIH